MCRLACQLFVSLVTFDVVAWRTCSLKSTARSGAVRNADLNKQDQIRSSHRFDSTLICQDPIRSIKIGFESNSVLLSVRILLHNEL